MRKKTLSIVAALFMCACGAWAQTAGAGSITVLPTDVMSKQSYMLVSPRGTLYFDANVKATSLTSNCSGPASPTKDVTVTAEEEKGQFLLFPAENYEHGYYVYSVAASKFIKQDGLRAALVDEPNVVYIWAHGATGTGTQAYSNASFEKSDYGFTIGSAYSSALPFNSINVCCWDASNLDYRWCETGSLDDGNMYAIVEAEEVDQDVWKAAYDKIYNVGYTVNIEGAEAGAIVVDEETYGDNATFSHALLTADDIKVTPVEGYLATVSISDEHIITVTYTEKTFKPTDAYTLFAQKSQRGYLASWTGESNYVSLAGVTLVDGGIDYSTKHPALNAEGVAIKWELDEVAMGKVTFKNLANGKYLANVNGKAKWSDTPTEFSYTKEADDSYHFQANNNFLTAACGYAESDGAVLIKGHEDASDFVVTKVDRDTENPDIDADLVAAQAALENYLNNVVIPALNIYNEIEIPDELYDVYEDLSITAYLYLEGHTPDGTDLVTAEDYTKALDNLTNLFDDYEEVKSQLEPDAETDLDKAKAAYDAAVAEYMALIEQYGSLANTSAEAHEIIENLNTSIKWVVDKDATAEEYNTVANIIKTGVEAAAEALEEIAGSTPDVAHFPEAGTYYVTFTGQADGRKNHLYNDLTQADGFTLQSDKPEVVTNNYVWRVVSDGQGKMTLRNGQGSTMKLCSGQNPVITELGYEAHNNAYYLLVTAQGLKEDSHNCLNVSNGSYKNAAGTPAVTTWGTNANDSAPNAGDNHWAVTEVAASSVYNVVVEGNEEGYAILGSEYAGNNGFFLSSDVANVSAKDVDHFSYTVDIEEETKTIKVTYTATEEPINVTYKVFVGEELVCGYEKTEYVGDAISFNTVIPEYVEVTADIPETVPTEGIVEIHTSYKEGALPFEVNGNYNLALNRTPNLNIFVDANNGIHTEAVASTEETEANYVWTIGGDWYNGFTLKSVAANKYVSFGTANPAKDSTPATLVESTDGEGATFDLVTKDGMNYFKLHGTTNNAYISNCGGTKTTYLTNWNSAGNIGDAGAQFIFTKVESTPEVDELAEALDFLYESAEATLDYLRTNYGAAVVGLKAEDAIEELNVLIVGLRALNKPTTMEEIEEAYDAVSAAALKFYDSCTITVLSRVISEAKEGEETEPTTIEKVKEIEDAILAKYGISALSNKK